MLNLDLTGRRAIVTGGTKGIGEGCVRLLADHGATVAFCGRSADAVEVVAAYSPPSGDGSVHGYIADMSDAGSTENFLSQIDADIGPIDIVVNNVGGSPSRNFLYMTDEDWESLHQLNMMSAVRCTRHCLPHMRKQKWGRIVMVASLAGFYPDPALIDYSGTKASMIATAKALAIKYGPDNVLVNTINPGYVRTAMWERAATEIADASGVDKESVFDDRSQAIPLRRYGTCDEIASGVVFLCSEAASYVSGNVLTIDGAFSDHI
jgi:3-oxoacyl-[acyl-carrier protein] reductase